MRKIGSITPVWNQEAWILPHFEMLKALDRNVVLLHKRPLPAYHKEHGYSIEPDLSEYLLRTYFPNVEIIQSKYPENTEFGPELYNEGLRLMQDCNLVFRLDPDMFFTQRIWNDLLSYIRRTNYDCYHMDFSKDSINYYMTGDFEHGLKDAQEWDPLVVNPKYMFQSLKGALFYPDGTHNVIKFDDFLCHHFRGWGKPKSTPTPAWGLRPEAFELVEKYGDSGEWYKAPSKIVHQVESSLKNVDRIKIAMKEEMK